MQLTLSAASSPNPALMSPWISCQLQPFPTLPSVTCVWLSLTFALARDLEAPVLDGFFLCFPDF